MKLFVLRWLSPSRRRLLWWCLGLFLAYTIIGFLVLPPIIRSVAAKQLSQQLDRQVTIQKVKLNPFTVSTTIRGLLVRDKDSEPFLSWEEVHVNFQLSSFFGRAWVFREIRTSQPFVRVQMNKDHTFNFSDLITKFSTNSAVTPKAAAKPLTIQIDRLYIGGATAALTDLTPRTPFRRVVGPLNINLENFHTDPDRRNPHSFVGTTDAGEKFSWDGFFHLDPFRAEGEFILEKLTLNKYAALYQDLLRFEIRDGVADARAQYRFELSATNRVAVITNSSFRLHSFKVADPGSESYVAQMPEFAITGASLDVVGRAAAVESISGSGGLLNLRREKNNAINVVELSQPAGDLTNAPGGVMFLLQSVTNVVALLLNSTNHWMATIHDVNFTNCALGLEDLANERPVRMTMDEISLSAQHISNVPGSNLTAAVSLRWNTNGAIRAAVQAGFQPATVDVQLKLDRLELRPLDPYLEPRLNLFVLDSRMSLDGEIHLRSRPDQLPEVGFSGDVRLDDFSTVDGVLAEDLLKWGSVRVTGIRANLHPPEVAVREITVDDAYARLVIETNRTINLVAALRMGEKNAPASAPAEPAAEPKPNRKTSETADASLSMLTNALAALPKISVANVVVSNAQIRFTDRSMRPNVNLTIQEAGGTISGLSSDLQRAELKLHARVDNVGPVEITGSINPFRQDLTNAISIAVNNVDLTPASPYVGKYAGYQLAKGKLALNLDYELQGRQLRSQNVIVLDQFTFGEKVDSPDATKLPVRLAIAILKDREGRIRLDVPVEGSFDDPQFRVRKVVLSTIGNVLTKIATSPFSVLGAIFGGGGEELSYQDFVAGTAELQPGATQKLDSLIKGLYERPALQLEIEGSIDPATDLEGLRRGAIEKRIRNVKWMSLRKTEQAALNPELVVVTAEERVEFLKRAFAEALAKGELASVLSDTNQFGTNVVSAVSATLVRALAGAPSTSEKGAAALMRLSSESSEPAAVTNSTGQPVKSAAETTMEQVLASLVLVGDSDFQTLAAARAQAVRQYILASGKVEPERIFLVEKESGGVKNEGSRAYLQFR